MASGYQRLYIRSASGVEMLSDTQTIAAFDYASTARVEIGDSLNARTPKAACALMAIAGTAWDDTLARRVLENPWRLIGNDVRPKPSLAAAAPAAALAGSVTGTATTTGALTTAIRLAAAATVRATVSADLTAAGATTAPLGVRGAFAVQRQLAARRVQIQTGRRRN